jgi:hypothetical protein
MPALKDYGVRLTAAPNLHGHWVMTLQTAHIVGASVVVQLGATVIVPPDKFPDVEEYFLLHGFAEDERKDAGHRTWTKTDPDGMVHRWAGSRVVNPLVN